MEKILPFITRHWFLVALFIVALIWLIIEESKNKGGGRRLSPQSMTRLINSENAVVLDIRDANAFTEGHITGAINVPASELDRTNCLEKYKQRSLVLVCSTGQRASTAMNKLHKQGYTKVYILAGGLAAWKNAGLPLVRR